MAALLLATLSGPAALAQEEDTRAELGALSEDPEQWVMPAKNYASTRYSELDQINTENVDQLQQVWSFSNGVNRGQESIPLVVGNTLYIVGPWPNNLFALNATTGDLKWIYSPPTAQAAKGVACCDWVNRGPAYANGKIFFNTLDNHTVAVDAATGKELWHTKLADINLGSTMTMAPLAVKDKVIVGNSGGELGVRGFIAGLDQETGEVVWRAYHTGPDEDVLIGEDFQAPYPWMEGEDLGLKTWPPERWKTGGGTVWGWVSYDPELDLIFYGSGNPGPWNPHQREGVNLWTSTLFARDPDTGQARWAYQTAPHDLWDHDSINEMILLDLEIDGEMREVIVHPGRTGYMYVLDRATGKLVSAEAFGSVNAYLGVDLETGMIIPNPEKHPRLGKVVEDVCPAAPGAKDWQPSAWSPKTQLLYVPRQHICMNFKASEVGYIAGTPYLGATVDMYAGPGNGHRGEYMAWDPVRQKKVWAIQENFPVWSGTTVTAGNVAFYGTMDRWFKAVDARTGELLWKFRAPSGIIGQPSTYVGADGRQYVAILSGVGGWSGVVAAAAIDPQVRNGALGFVGATQDLPAYTKGGSTLMVFALPKQGESVDHEGSATLIQNPEVAPAGSPLPIEVTPPPVKSDVVSDETEQSVPADELLEPPETEQPLPPADPLEDQEPAAGDAEEIREIEEPSDVEQDAGAEPDEVEVITVPAEPADAVEPADPTAPADAGAPGTMQADPPAEPAAGEDERAPAD